MYFKSYANGTTMFSVHLNNTNVLYETPVVGPFWSWTVNAQDTLFNGDVQTVWVILENDQNVIGPYLEFHLRSQYENMTTEVSTAFYMTDFDRPPEYDDEEPPPYTPNQLILEKQDCKYYI